MSEKIISTCLIQEYLNLKEGTVIKHQGRGSTRIAHKISETTYQIEFRDHELKTTYMFIGIEKIPDIFSGGSVVLLENVDKAHFTLASKWLWLDKNKIVYMCWINQSYGPENYFKIIT